MVMVNMYVDTQEALVHSKANLYVSRMEHRRRCLSPSIFIFFFLFFFLLRSLLRCSVILSCWGDILSETWEMKFVLSFHVTTQIPACSFANWNMASEITTARGGNCEIVSQNHSRNCTQRKTKLVWNFRKYCGTGMFELLVLSIESLAIRASCGEI